MNGFAPGLDCRPPSRWMGGQGGQSRKVLGRSLSDFGAFFSKNWNGREAILWLSRLDYPLAKTGGAVNGGAWNAPFILTVDCSAGFATHLHINHQISRIPLYLSFCLCYYISATQFNRLWGRHTFGKNVCLAVISCFGVNCVATEPATFFGA